MSYINFRNFQSEYIEEENVIIGSGAGGSTTAYELLKKNKSCLIIEEGPLPEDETSTNIGKRITKLYKNNGVTPLYATNKGPLIGYGQGNCVGGSTYINAGYFAQIPENIFNSWKKNEKINFNYSRYIELINEIRDEIDINKSKLSREDIDSKKIFDGSRKLNWKTDLCNRFSKNCQRSNSSPIGCLNNSKQSMNITYHKKLIENKINIIYNCKVVKIVTEKNNAKFIYLKKFNSKILKIKFKNLFICCGPINSPGLLLKNKLIKNEKNDKPFEFHINFKIVVKFKEEINSNKSTSGVCFMREFEDEGALLSSAYSELNYILATLSHFDYKIQRDVIDNYNKIGFYVYQIKANSRGEISIFLGNEYVKYKFDNFDLLQIQKAITRSASLFFSADAEYILYPIQGSGKITSPKKAFEITENINPQKLHLVSVHGMSSLHNSNNKFSKTDYNGKLNNFNNIYINDASILPGNFGESPQASIMAFTKNNIENTII